MKKRVSVILIALAALVSASAMSGCAIATPAVVGVINNANESTNQSNASELDAAAKTLYAGVVAGTLTSDTPSDELGDLSAYKLPDRGSSVQIFRDAANSLTIKDAIDYSGLGTKFESEISNYGYDSAGTIQYIGSDSDTGITVLSLYTTLGEMYG